MPYLRTLSSFRDGVRKLAIAKGDSALKDILALSDKLRDVDLVPLGVALDDQEGVSERYHLPLSSLCPLPFLSPSASLSTLLTPSPSPLPERLDRIAY